MTIVVQKKRFFSYKCLPFIPTADQKNDPRGGHNKITVLLNIETFKLLCIKAETKKAHEIHKYFVQLENLLHDIVLEECNELKVQMEQAKQETLQAKQETLQQKEENKMLLISRKVPTIYIYNTDTRIEHQPLLKIGITQCIAERIKPYKQTHPYGKVVYHQEVDEDMNIKTMEHFIHHTLSNFRVQGEVFVSKSSLIISSPSTNNTSISCKIRISETISKSFRNLINSFEDNPLWIWKKKWMCFLRFS